MSMPALTAITHRWEGAVAGHLGRSEHVHVARRCADLAELLGCAGAGVGKVAAISVDLRGVDRSTVAELTDQGIRVLGVYPPGDEAGERTLRRWGLSAIVSGDAPEAEVHAVIARLVGEAASLGGDPADQRGETDAAQGPDLDAEFAAYLDGSAGANGPHGSNGSVGSNASDGAAPGPSPTGNESLEELPVHGGQLIAVWGPTGSPGRSTVAVNLAAELARTDETLIIDADTYGASIAQMLAVLDEAPGLAAAARAADSGLLDVNALARLSPHVHSRLRVLTGLPRPDRWPELREHAVADVLAQATSLARWTVVDAGFCLEQDEEISFDTLAPRRNGVTLRVLEAADQVILVGSGDPISLQRLVRAVNDLRELTTVPCTIVVTRVRASAVGRYPKAQISDVLARFASVHGLHFVPEDRDAVDAALLAGATLGEIRPSSPARVAIVELAESVTGKRADRQRVKARARWGKN